MAQPSGGTMNFLIHDANGQTQMIKVATNTPKGATVLRQGQVIKTLKPVNNPSENSSQFDSSGGNQVPLRTISLQSTKTGQRQIVTLPMMQNNDSSSSSASPSPIFVKQEMQEYNIDEDNQYSFEQPYEIQKFEHDSQELLSPSPQHLPNSSFMSSSSVLENYITSTPQYQEVKYAPSRKRTAEDVTAMGSFVKRSRGEKASKGLRHFSMKVCEKVRRKGVTTYNEVADELVQEFSESHSQDASASDQYDQKNIRRRVYDALNVLMAMNIISKEKKEIKWLGLPTNSLQESLNLNKEKKHLINEINNKLKRVHDVLLNHVSLQQLIWRNKEHEKKQGPPGPSVSIPLPFLLVGTDKQTVIDCSLSNDKTEYLFVFNNRFTIHDDFEILRDMNLCMGLDKGTWTQEQLKHAESLLPPTMTKFLHQVAYGEGFLAVDDEEGEEQLDEDGMVSYDESSNVTIETVMPDEVFSLSSDADSDLSSDVDHV